MKILLSAYSCFPCQTSEPGNAWRAINEALREHEVWAVIADAHQYRELTEPVLAKNPLPNFHPVFFKLPPALQWLAFKTPTNLVTACGISNSDPNYQPVIVDLSNWPNL